MNIHCNCKIIPYNVHCYKIFRLNHCISAPSTVESHKQHIGLILLFAAEPKYFISVMSEQLKVYEYSFIIFNILHRLFTDSQRTYRLYYRFRWPFNRSYLWFYLMVNFKLPSLEFASFYYSRQLRWYHPNN